MKISNLFKIPESEVERMMKGMKKTADQYGVELNPEDRISNSRLAQELGYFAMQEGLYHEFHNAVFKAYFVEGKNIGDIDILLDIAEKSGLHRKKSEEALLKGSFKAEVDKDWLLSNELKITAVPTIIYGNERIIGAKPYDKLLEKIFS